MGYRSVWTHVYIDVCACINAGSLWHEIVSAAYVWFVCLFTYWVRMLRVETFGVAIVVHHFNTAVHLPNEVKSYFINVGQVRTT